MEIINIKAYDDFVMEEQYVSCIGYFDGVHRGHQKLIERVVQLSKENKAIASVICFDEDPWIVLHKSKDTTHITPLKKRLKLFESFGINVCFLLHFDEEMAQLSKHAFIQLLNKINLSHLVCGNDFKFAQFGSGKVDDLKKQPFVLHVVDDENYNGKKISSSAIEENIKMGYIEEANQQLMHIYALTGMIVHGNHVGKSKLGFASANLMMDDSYVLPKRGVYSGFVRVREQCFKAMINIGFNPTMNHKEQVSIEAHLLDFEQDIYGEEVTFYFTKYIREEKKFDSVTKLIEQLNYDVALIKKQ